MNNHQGLSRSDLKDVPFIDQDEYLCAPASLAMILQHAGKQVSRDELKKKLVTDKAKGTFATNVISEVRYQGMLGLPITNMKDLLTEVSQGHPLMVLQNLGLSQSIAPKWHYAVVTGFNLTREKPTITMHSGHEKNQKTKMKLFEETWNMADSWGLLVLNPGELSSTQDEFAHVTAAAGLERVNKIHEARLSYQSILRRWPQSLAALIGMGNITFTEKKYKASLGYLTDAVTFHPTSPMAWHNLATLEGILGKEKEARASAARAMSLVGKEESSKYRESLKRWL